MDGRAADNAGNTLMPLDADQKAMLRLLAQREQGYADIGALMGLSVEEVRDRVRAALAELDTEAASARQSVEQPATSAQAAEKPAAAPETDRATVPPAEAKKPSPPPAEAKKPSPRPSAARKPSRPPRRPGGLASRLPRLSAPGSRWRVVELIGGAVVVILVILFATGAINIGGGGGGSGPVGSAESASEAAANPKLTQAILKPVNGGEASGRALFGRLGKRVALQVEAEGLEPPPHGQSYVIWLAKSPHVMVPLTPIEVGKSGRLAVQYPLPSQVLAYLAGRAFDEISISLVSAPLYKVALTKAKKEGKPPAYTGTDVLRGPITGPIVGAALKQGGQ